MLINAQEMAEKHPDTFYAPPLEDLDHLTPGLFVKVCVETEGGSSERFWVTIDSIENGEIKGTVSNNLLFTDQHGFDYGGEITLKPENVYEVEAPEAPVVH